MVGTLHTAEETVLDRALLTSTHPAPTATFTGPSPSRSTPGYLLFTVRNMDLLMSVPTPLLAWQR